MSDTQPDLEIWTELEMHEDPPLYGPFLPPPPPINPVAVRWYCGYFLANTGGFFEDPDECGGETETVEEKEDWDARICQTYCPACGVLLYQIDGHAERVDSLP